MRQFPTLVAKWFALVAITAAVHLGLAGAGIAVVRLIGSRVVRAYFLQTERMLPLPSHSYTLELYSDVAEAIIMVISFIAAVIIAASVVRDWETK